MWYVYIYFQANCKIVDKFKAKKAFPAYPQYGTEEARLTTFTSWTNKEVDPGSLAAAGFFYAGKLYQKV